MNRSSTRSVCYFLNDRERLTSALFALGIRLW